MSRNFLINPIVLILALTFIGTPASGMNFFTNMFGKKKEKIIKNDNDKQEIPNTSKKKISTNKNNLNKPFTRQNSKINFGLTVNNIIVDEKIKIANTINTNKEEINNLQTIPTTENISKIENVDEDEVPDFEIQQPNATKEEEIKETNEQKIEATTNNLGDKEEIKEQINVLTKTKSRRIKANVRKRFDLFSKSAKVEKIDIEPSIEPSENKKINSTIPNMPAKNSGLINDLLNNSTFKKKTPVKKTKTGANTEILATEKIKIEEIQQVPTTNNNLFANINMGIQPTQIENQIQNIQNNVILDFGDLFQQPKQKTPNQDHTLNDFANLFDFTNQEPVKNPAPKTVPKKNPAPKKVVERKAPVKKAVPTKVVIEEVINTPNEIVENEIQLHEPIVHVNTNQVIELLKVDFKNTYGCTCEVLKNEAAVKQLLPEILHEDITNIYVLLADPKGKNIETAYEIAEKMLEKAGHKDEVDLIEFEVEEEQTQTVILVEQDNLHLHDENAMNKVAKLFGATFKKSNRENKN